MRVLLAGATGAIGRPLVRSLVEAGHEVVALTRREEKLAELDAAGARGVVCDVCDRKAVLAVVGGAQPHVVMDQTTALPQRYDARRMDLFYKDMIPLRMRGTPNLFEAAERAEARLFFQSVAFLYAPNGTPHPKTEEDPPYLEGAPYPWDAALPPIVALEERAVDQGGVVLRYGIFYGPGTHLDEGNQLAEDIKRRRLPIVGRGEGMGSFIHVEDAAAATVKALDWPGSGILNIVDDRPLPVREWIPAAAEALGAKKPLRVPTFVARLASGPLPVHMATAMPGVSNAKAKRELGWAPRYPSVRDGLQASAR
jgi:nucleoside-diphosphate-sugar epimerase